MRPRAGTPRRRAALPPRQIERLGRGGVAVPAGIGRVFVSWRLLATDPEGVAFDVYRSTAAAERGELRRVVGRRPAPRAARPERRHEVELDREWNWTAERLDTMFVATGAASNDGTKATPVLSGDVLGDWREEVILRAADDPRELRIYTTTIPTAYRFVTLMHDPVHRLGMAWQNVAYSRPPHTGFSLGVGMTPR